MELTSSKLNQSIQNPDPVTKRRINFVLQCNALKQAGLADRLTYPGQDVYTSRVESYWSLAAQLDPYCIIQPQNAGEVSQAVVALVQANKTQPCKFAVRSGGHTTVSL